MLSTDFSLETNGRHAPREALRTRSAACSPHGFAALTNTALAPRYLSWRGRSGASYVFSVYAAGDCPAFCDAVLIVVETARDGRRRALAVLDTGPFPEPALARAERAYRSGGPLEFHVHLLARAPADRRAVIADLAFDLAKTDGPTPSNERRAEAIRPENRPQPLEKARNAPGFSA